MKHYAFQITTCCEMARVELSFFCHSSIPSAIVKILIHQSPHHLAHPILSWITQGLDSCNTCTTLWQLFSTFQFSHNGRNYFVPFSQYQSKYVFDRLAVM